MPDAQDEAQRLLNEQAQLSEQLAALKQKEQELIEKQRELEAARKMAEAAIPTKVEVVRYDDNRERIYLKLTKYSDDAINIFRSIPGRMYHGEPDRLNSFDVQHWEELRSKLVERFDIVWADGIQDRIQRALNRPQYHVGFNGRETKLEVAVNNADSLIIRNIPGARWYSQERKWTMPVAEGWRLYAVLMNRPRVEWDEDALKLVKDDVEKRDKIDKIALKTESDLVNLDLNGQRLKPFQAVAVEFFEEAGGRAIGADQMGLGKTPEALAYAVKNNFRICVICPASLKLNWAREIFKFTGEYPKVFRGIEPKMRDVQTILIDKPRYVVINYDIMSRKVEVANEYHDTSGKKFEGDKREIYMWVDTINAGGFDVVIFDEAHYIKNVDSNRSKASRRIQAPHVLFLTGTPVTNRPRELWPMLTIINPSAFPSHESFLSSYEDNYGNARNAAELRELLKPIMIRRTKKDVLKDLPPINRIYEFEELSEKATKIYNKVLQGVFQLVAELGVEGEEKAVPNILAQIMRLKQVCAIDKMDRIAELSTELYDSAENGEAKKVLIFSQFVPVARGIARRLGHESICVTGETSQEERFRMVDLFQNDPNVHFLVATNKVLGEGFNITAAGHVIFADLFWTPAAHEQCEGRAYGRMSDLHSINSYYVISQLADEEESIENWIQQILARKLSMITEVVEGLADDRGKSIANELLSRLKDEMGKRGKR